MESPTSTETGNKEQPSRFSPQARIGLAVIAFAVVTLMLTVLGGGSSIPAEGTPILNYEATDAQRTVVAELALSPAPEGEWVPFMRGRRKPTHDLEWMGDTLYVATDDGLLVLDSTAEEPFSLAPGFPEEYAAERVWQRDDQLIVGLADNYLTSLVNGTWSEPILVELMFPPPFPVPAADQIPAGAGDVCDFLGMLAASNGDFWIACPESIVQIYADGTQTRYLAGGLAGLPGEPTGALAEGPDGRLWVGLDNGVTALSME